MARTFYGVVRQAARAAERAHRHAVAERQRVVRQAEKAQKAAYREQLRRAKLADRAAQQAYIHSREQEVAEMNQDLGARIHELRSVLSTAGKRRLLNLNSLKRSYVAKTFTPSPSPREPLRTDFNTQVEPPSLLGKMLGGKPKYERQVEEARQGDEQAYQAAHEKWIPEFATWQHKESESRAKFELGETRRREEIENHNSAIDALEKGYASGDSTSASEYFSIVLESLELPNQFPAEFRVSFVSESRQLIIEYSLPTLDVIPTTGEYSYIKGKDEIREKPRKKSEIKEVYEAAIAGTCLRVLHEIFSSDRAEIAQTIVFNGIVNTISPETGKEISPCIVSARVTRAEFLEINIDRIDPVYCLRALGAVSKRPDELAPVRPIVEFDMVDPRFVAERDVLSSLESRPNIMELNPFEFENLVTNLFSKMGLDARQTRSSRDGGVDAIAFDLRPVLGGKVVIQAKRYKNTVGVAAVRDLYGTMMNEGANKGILVTTAGYGPDAYEFAKDKPIELIEGTTLLYLLEEQGIQARILMIE